VITRRRITLQLVPLLDLLFIVLFAQYIDLQDATRNEIASAEVQRQQVEAERLRAEAERAQADQLRTDALNQLEELNRQGEQWEIERRRLMRELELAREANAASGIPEMMAQAAGYFSQAISDTITSPSCAILCHHQIAIICWLSQLTAIGFTIQRIQKTL